MCHLSRQTWGLLACPQCVPWFLDLWILIYFHSVLEGGLILLSCQKSSEEATF